MKRTLIALLALSSLLVTAAPAAAASERAAALKRELGSGARVATSRETGVVRFVGTAAGRPLARPAGVSASAPARDVARAFLAQHGTAFGIADGSRDLRVISSYAGSGHSTVRLQQLHSGIPVVGGELVVNLDRAGRVLSASGEAGAAPPTTKPRVNSATAREAAIATIAKHEQVSAVRLRATSAELGVYDSRLLGGPGPQLTRLVWRLEVKGAPGVAVNQLVLVDAETGNAILNINQIEAARTQRICDAGNTLVPAAGSFPCNPGAAVAAEPGNPPGAGDDGDVAPAYEFAADTYDFYFSRFGRRSLDDEDMTLVSTVDYCDPNFPSDCPDYDNAFWNGSQMAYGNGYAAGDDVVGHELTHGVTDFSAHLFYYYQSGAINESLSDVMGEYMDQTNGVGNDSAGVKWQMGEDLPIGAIRNMANPPAFGDPDSTTSPNYFGGEADSGGVHTNSGVNNKAAFLIADGGTFGGQTVTGLGITKAARVYYDAQTRYLTSGSDYADLASVLPQSCNDNVGGPEGITAANCTEVGDAVAAVKMSSDPPAAPAPEAPVCGAGLVQVPRFSDDLENPASGNWTAEANWYFPQTSHPYVGWDPSYGTSFTTNFWGEDVGSTSDSSIAMTRSVAIPAASTAYFRFNHAYGFEDNTASAFDGGVLEYSTNAGTSWTDAGPLLTDNGYNGTLSSPSTNPLAGKEAFVRESNGYRSSRATISSLSGQNVRFRFRMGTDSAVGDFYGWFIDDISLYTCEPPGADADGDGDANGADNCPGASNPGQADTDGDGQGDACDGDDDDDRVHDSRDNCVTVANKGQEDLDRDGAGDACDPDDDGDTVADGGDNCPRIANSNQANADGDAQGDACDADDDNDGRADTADACPTVAAATPNGCPPAATGGGATPGGGGSSSSAVTLKSAKLRSCKISGKGKKLRVKCTLSKSGAVRRATITIKKGKKTVLKKSLKPTSKGVLSIKPKRKLAKGSYKVSIVIRDSAGKKRTLKKTLKVKRAS
jgi:bacillolysin